MTITTANNRTSLTLNVRAEGNAFVIMANEIHAICVKYNAQENLYSNKSHLKFDKKGNVIGTQMGDMGGTITFHSHSCDHAAAATEMVELLSTYGMTVTEKLKEVVKTHRADGTAYKKPQTILEKA